MELEIEIVAPPFAEDLRAELIALWGAAFRFADEESAARMLNRALAAPQCVVLMAVVADENDSGKKCAAGGVIGGHDGLRGVIYYLAADPRWRRRGVGRALLRAMEDELAARGCRQIALEVRPENKEAAVFYERMGYGAQRRLNYTRALNNKS